MNKHTINAIQARINAGQTEFAIGAYRYVCHYDHPVYLPFIHRYAVNGGGEPFNAGNIAGGQFIPDVMPARRPDLKWYAVISDLNDYPDWGIGSYDRTEAEKMVVRSLDVNPDGYIAVIDQGGGEEICVDEIKPEDFSDPYMYAARIVKAHDWDACRDDLDNLMDLLDLGGEWAAADGDTFEAVIRKAGEKIGVDLI